MAEKGLVSRDALTAIADAIRAKGGTSAAILPGEMAALINAISTGVALPSWVNKIDFASVSLSSTSNESVSIPTTLGAKPTGMVFYRSSYSISNTYGARALGYWYKVVGSSVGAGIHSSMDTSGNYVNINFSGMAAATQKISLSYSGGKVNITCGSGYPLYSGTYYAIMWR